MSGRFCTQCGEPLAGARFCTTCGTKAPAIASEPPAVAAATQRPTAKVLRTLRCITCGSEISQGLVCARCASQAASPQAATSHAVGPTASSPNPPKRPARKRDGWGDYDWALAKRLVAWLAVLVAATLGIAAIVHSSQHSTDGRYVCGEAGFPMTVEISGDSGVMAMGIARITLMDVKRIGDTVALSGGHAVDAEGHEINEATRRALTGGNDVDLFTLTNNGQSLTLPLDNGTKAVFVRQP